MLIFGLLVHFHALSADAVALDSQTKLSVGRNQAQREVRKLQNFFAPYTVQSIGEEAGAEP